MENKDLYRGATGDNSVDTESQVTLRYSPEAQQECFIDLRGQLIKLLYLIEAEQRGEGDASLFFFSLMREILAANDLCDQKLTRVARKIHGLYFEEAYKTMSHKEIKCMILDARGIIDHLIIKKQ